MVLAYTTRVPSRSADDSDAVSLVLMPCCGPADPESYIVSCWVGKEFAFNHKMRILQHRAHLRAMSRPDEAPQRHGEPHRAGRGCRRHIQLQTPRDDDAHLKSRVSMGPMECCERQRKGLNLALGRVRMANGKNPGAGKTQTKTAKWNSSQQ